jgi:hypothetical protein
MNEETDAPQISKTDLDRPNPANPGDTGISSFATRQETLDGLQANDAEKMTPDEANELSTDEGE